MIEAFHVFCLFFIFFFSFCWLVSNYLQFHCLCPLNLASAQLLLGFGDEFAMLSKITIEKVRCI